MSDTEQRARDMGWRPQEEWNGPPENWKSAEDFLRVADNYMPVLKERLGKLETELAAVRAESKKAKASLTKLAEHHRGTWKRQYEKALSDVKAQMREAVQLGDTDRYSQLEKHEQQIIEQAAAEDPANQQGPVDEFYEFHERNPWYGTDPEMSMYADGLQAILVNNEGITDHKVFFQEVEKRVKLRFPEKFKNVNQALPQLVESGEEGGGDHVPAEKGWGDVPTDAKAAYNEHFKDVMSKEQYAAEYWLQEGE